MTSNTVFIFILLLSACVNATNTSTSPLTQKKLIPLSNVNIQHDQIHFDVLSNGCTVANHFTFEQISSNHQCSISIYRIKPDLCKRASLPIKISLDWQNSLDCENKKIVFTNPVSTVPHSKF